MERKKKIEKTEQEKTEKKLWGINCCGIDAKYKHSWIQKERELESEVTGGSALEQSYISSYSFMNTYPTFKSE